MHHFGVWCVAPGVGNLPAMNSPELHPQMTGGKARLAGLGAVAFALIATVVLAFASPTMAHRAKQAAPPSCSEVSYPVNVLSTTYTMRGTLCRPPKGVKARAAALLVHGDTYSRVYWDFPVEPSKYSAARILAGDGYMTLAIDRLGSGASDLPPADQFTPDVGADAIHQVVTQLRGLAAQETTSGDVFAAGHSGGSTVVLRESAEFGDVDGIILTGFLHGFEPSAEVVAGSFHPTSEDPEFAGDATIPPGYKTGRPATRFVFYYPFTAEERVWAADEKTKSYLPGNDSSGFVEEIKTNKFAPQIKVPVMVMVGAWDLVVCTPPNCPEASKEAAHYPASPDVKVIVRPRTGHDLNLHTNAPETFELMRKWMDEHSR